jgi:hypothetical protein
MIAGPSTLEGGLPVRRVGIANMLAGFNAVGQRPTLQMSRVEAPLFTKREGGQRGGDKEETTRARLATDVLTLRMCLRVAMSLARGESTRCRGAG